MRRPKTSQALALRARIVLSASTGKTNAGVARELGITRGTVTKWRVRYLQLEPDGLLDESRPGVPRSISDAQIEEVVTRTLESMPKGATHWSTRSMAQASGLSQSTISRIWRAFGLQPHRIETFELSTDPLFVEKVRDIVGLDNCSTHKTPLIRNWLAAHPRYHVHFTPTSSSRLNLVERFFAAIMEKAIRRGVFRSTAELEGAIDTYLRYQNENPKPFAWTKSADDILATISRFCQRTSDSGH